MNGDFYDYNQNNQNNQNNYGGYQDNMTDGGVHFGANAFNKEAEPSFWSSDPGLNTGASFEEEQYKYWEDAPLPPKPKKPGKALSITSMVLGIVSSALSLVCCLHYVSWVLSAACGIAGLIIGVIALKKYGKDKKTIAGVVTSSVGIAVSVAFMILVGYAFVDIWQRFIEAIENGGLGGSYNDNHDSFSIGSILKNFRR